MEQTEQAGATRSRGAPYIAFQSLKTLISGMKEHGIPARVDRSVLGNFSGAVGSQIMTGVKFLGLTDADNHPTETLQALVEAHGTDAWQDSLAAIIRRSYEPLFVLNLEAASPAQFNERFRAAFPGADEVQRKQSTFFLNAAREAGIKISPYIMKNRKPRSAPAKRRPARAATSTASGTNGQVPPAVPPDSSDFMKQLLNKFPQFDPAWSEDLKAEWFKSFQVFMTHAKAGE